MRFCLIRRDEGSVTPLILGFAIIIAAIITTFSDITYLGNAHLALKSEGERVLAESMRDLSADYYYQGNSALGSSALGSSALGSSALGSSATSISAPGNSALGSSALGNSALGSSALGSSATSISALGSSTISTSASTNSVPINCQNTYINILNGLQKTRFYLSNEPIAIKGYKCKNYWIELEIATKVLLPFLPRFLGDINPTVTSVIRGGTRYFSD